MSVCTGTFNYLCSKCGWVDPDGLLCESITTEQQHFTLSSA